MKSYTLTVIDLKKETTDAMCIVFKQPGLRKIKYQAGQYITLILRINGRKYARPYSFSSAPSVDSYLEVTVKRVRDGIVSNYINNELKVGDIVEVLEPMGNFIFDNLTAARPIYLWGVGSGITPLFSIIKEVLHTQSNSVVHLIYGNKNQDSTIFINQLKLLQEQHPSAFSITNFYSQMDPIKESKTIHKGRISSEFVTKLLTEEKNVKESIHYICGPKGLKDIVKNSLEMLEIPTSSIFTEEFGLVIDPKELEGVEDCNVSLLFNGQLSDFFVSKGKSVLDIALDFGLEIPYSCQTGNCNTCKAKLKDGQLKMLGLSHKRDDLNRDEYLLCCSYPLTTEISLEVI